MTDFRILPAGDAAFVVEFGDSIDRASSDRVLGLAERIERAALAGVVETIPTFRSLLIAFDPDRVGFDALAQSVAALAALGRAPPRAKRRWIVPACYESELAPDLEAVCARAGLSAAAFAARHAAIAHRVYMLGFLPGQPYLGELPEALAVPRRPSPRARVEAGSIGVAMRMTCIFPNATPCGLNIVARTPFPLWSPARPSGALLSPGDEVAFRAISLDLFHEIAEEAARGVGAIRFDFADVGEAA